MYSSTPARLDLWGIQQCVSKHEKGEELDNQDFKLASSEEIKSPGTTDNKAPKSFPVTCCCYKDASPLTLPSTDRERRCSTRHKGDLPSMGGVSEVPVPQAAPEPALCCPGTREVPLRLSPLDSEVLHFPIFILQQFQKHFHNFFLAVFIQFY